MATTKKLINDGGQSVAEMVEGALAAFPRHFRQAAGDFRAVVAADGPRQGKVGLVIGGGSGHEPAFFGYVGCGLADAAAVGGVFASPPPDPILACTKAADGGCGVLYIFGNYAGDVMNFGMAAELASLDSIDVRTILTTDDVSSADQRDDRRGVAGNFFVFKIAGAACDKGFDLDRCEALARRANSATVTMGVALSACSLPQTLRPNFTIPDGEMEIGMGIHGEPGIARRPIERADAVVDRLYDRLAAGAGLGRGDEVAVLVNSLGATPMMELFILNRRLRTRLDHSGVAVHRTWIGPYCTSLEMAGASITLIKLDHELRELLDHPAHSPLVDFGGGA